MFCLSCIFLVSDFHNFELEYNEDTQCNDANAKNHGMLKWDYEGVLWVEFLLLHDNHFTFFQHKLIYLFQKIREATGCKENFIFYKNEHKKRFNKRTIKRVGQNANDKYEKPGWDGIWIFWYSKGMNKCTNNDNIPLTTI